MRHAASLFLKRVYSNGFSSIAFFKVIKLKKDYFKSCSLTLCLTSLTAGDHELSWGFHPVWLGPKKHSFCLTAVRVSWVTITKTAYKTSSAQRCSELWVTWQLSSPSFSLSAAASCSCYDISCVVEPPPGRPWITWGCSWPRWAPPLPSPSPQSCWCWHGFFTSGKV